MGVGPTHTQPAPCSPTPMHTHTHIQPHPHSPNPAACVRKEWLSLSVHVACVGWCHFFHRTNGTGSLAINRRSKDW